MGLRIQNNIAAMNAHRNLSRADTSLSKSLERLSSGYRVNKAADDAAGLAVSRGMRGEIKGLQAAALNTSQANSMMQVAEGALDQVQDILIRLRELATQASSANLGTTEKARIAAEGDELVAEIDRIVDSTKYSGQLLINGGFGSTTLATTGWADVANVYNISIASGTTAGRINVTSSTAGLGGAGDKLAVTLATNGMTQVKTLTDGAQSVNFNTFGVSFQTTAAFESTTEFANGTSMGALTVTSTVASSATFQIGNENNSDNRLTVTVGDANTAVLGTSAHGNGISDLGSGGANRLTDTTNARIAIDALDEAIDDISSIRGTVGAYQNRLSYASANLATAVENTQAAESVISDVDMAAEMTNFTKNQILLQAGTAMLAQANMAPQSVLTLLG